MRIGIFVADVAVKVGYEHVVSGHVQIPLQCAKLLAADGHDVHIITTKFSNGDSLPAVLDKSLPVHQVAYASRRINALVHRSRGRQRFKHLARVKTVLDLIKLTRAGQFDILHFYGAAGTADLAAVIRASGPRCPVVLTLNVGHVPDSISKLRRWLWKRIDRILVSTEYFKKRLENIGVQACVVRHGAVRALAPQNTGSVPKKHRVLFWREASPINGGDICVQAFRKLAPMYQDISFDFAVRPHRLQPPELDDLIRQFPNVHLYATPYPEGITLEKLLAESICVVQPFRRFTFQPQLSMLESLQAGAAVIATDVDSTTEMIESGVSGLIVPPESPDSIVAAVQMLIGRRDHARELGLRALAQSREKWNWDRVVWELLHHYGELRKADSSRFRSSI